MCPFFLQSGGSDDDVESEGDAAVSAEVYLPVDEQRAGVAVGFLQWSCSNVLL